MLSLIGDTHITSHDQKSGITGQNVNVSTTNLAGRAQAPDAPSARESWWSQWGSISEIIALMVATDGRDTDSRGLLAAP
jgi:hypothetical protein